MNKSLFSFILVISLLINVQAQGDQSFNVQIKAVHTDYERIAMVRVSVTNNSGSPLYFAKWGTPFAEETFNNPFDIKINGKKATYLGKLSKRGKLKKQDFILIPEDGTISRDINLSQYYQLDQSGKYNITYKQDNSYSIFADVKQIFTEKNVSNSIQVLGDRYAGDRAKAVKVYRKLLISYETLKFKCSYKTAGTGLKVILSNNKTDWNGERFSKGFKIITARFASERRIFCRVQQGTGTIKLSNKTAHTSYEMNIKGKKPYRIWFVQRNSTNWRSGPKYLKSNKQKVLILTNGLKFIKKHLNVWQSDPLIFSHSIVNIGKIIVSWKVSDYLAKKPKSTRE